MALSNTMKFKIGDEVIIRDGVCSYSVTQPGSYGKVIEVDYSYVNVDFQYVTGHGVCMVYRILGEHLDFKHPVKDWD
jgi:hypothetical protein